MNVTRVYRQTFNLPFINQKLFMAIDRIASLYFRWHWRLMVSWRIESDQGHNSKFAFDSFLVSTDLLQVVQTYGICFCHQRSSQHLHSNRWNA
jgi:hypothetical protein